MTGTHDLYCHRPAWPPADQTSAGRVDLRRGDASIIMPEPAVIDREPCPSTTCAPSRPATEPAPQGPHGTATGGCPNCGSLESWGHTSWCPKCGFYPRLGISLGPALDVVEDVHDAPDGALDVWRRMPGWGRVLVVGVFAIFAASVAVRLQTHSTSSLRNTWAAVQLGLGVALFCVVHGVAMVRATAKLDTFGFVDAVIHPVETWKPTISELPARAARVWTAAWGLTAALCAVVIIGGIRYSRLVEDWGVRHQANSEIRSKVSESALQKAIGKGLLSEDFEKAAEKRGEQEARAAAEAAKKGIDLELRSADCVVIGYKLDPHDGSVSELLLASLVEGELQYVGSVSDGIPLSVRRELAMRLKSVTRDRPFVNCPASGTWVKPVISCKTNFKSWTPDKMFDGATFTELLADLDQ